MVVVIVYCGDVGCKIGWWNCCYNCIVIVYVVLVVVVVVVC